MLSLSNPLLEDSDGQTQQHQDEAKTNATAERRAVWNSWDKPDGVHAEVPTFYYNQEVTSSSTTEAETQEENINIISKLTPAAKGVGQASKFGELRPLMRFRLELELPRNHDANDEFNDNHNMNGGIGNRKVKEEKASPHFFNA